MKNKDNAFRPNHFYHVYNRSVGGEKLFMNDENHRYFLDRYRFHLEPVVQTYAWCMMGNHFHFMVQVRDEQNLDDFFRKERIASLSGAELHQPEHIVSKQLASFFSGYTQAFNKLSGRTGGLFQSPFKRKLVDTETYCAQLLVYIHQNPQKHRVSSDFQQYKHSSYNHYLNEKRRTPEMHQMMQWFGETEDFVQAHAHCELPSQYWLEE